ncbi:MAG: AIR synthase-related protein, partial [Thermoplasmatota archaeon]
VGILSHFQHATTMDLKEEGNAIVLLGDTERELGGSLLMDLLGLDGEQVPRTDPADLARGAEFLVTAIEAGQVRAAHDLSEGGLAVAAAEMAFAGKMGISLDIAGVAPELRRDVALFSESNTRWLVEVPTEHLDAFLGAAADNQVSALLLGHVTDDGVVEIKADERELLVVESAKLRAAWSEAMPKLVQGDA